jgi:hypothetical protein
MVPELLKKEFRVVSELEMLTSGLKLMKLQVVPG